MFKFDKYPEIKKAHDEYQSIRKKWRKLEIEEYKYNKETYENLFNNLWNQINDFKFNVYAKAVFEAFNPIKPTLRAVWEQNKPYTWEEIVGESIDEYNEDQRRVLFGMVEEEDPYILPAEYYIGKTHVEEYLENEARSK